MSALMADAPERPFLTPKNRRTRLTPVGWAVIVVGLIAALVPGARLVGASILSAALLAPLLAWFALRRLRAAGPSPACVMAGKVLVLDIPVRNVSRLFTARDVTLHHVSEHGGGLRAAWFLPDLGAGDSHEAAPRFRSLRRGRVREHTMVAITSFPFGLAFSLAEFELPADLLVLPRPGQARGIYELMGNRGLSPSRASHTSSEGEFVGLREWREGESPRLIHWKSTARRGRPILREMVSEDRQPVHVVLAAGVSHLLATSGAKHDAKNDSSNDEPPDSKSRQRAERAFERAVNVAATFVAALLKNGHRVRLTVTGADGEGNDGARSGRGRAGLVPLLAVLADAQACAALPDFAAGAGASRMERTVCLAAGTREAAGRQVQAPSTSALLLFADDPAVRARFVDHRGPRLRRTESAAVRS